MSSSSLLFAINEKIIAYVSSLAGAMEVFIVPLTDNIHDTNVIYLSKTNCYGAGILAGIMVSRNIFEVSMG